MMLYAMDVSQMLDRQHSRRRHAPPAWPTGSPGRPASKRNQVRRSASSIQVSSKLALATSPCSSQGPCVSRICAASCLLSLHSSANMSRHAGSGRYGRLTVPTDRHEHDTVILELGSVADRPTMTRNDDRPIGRDGQIGVCGPDQPSIWPPVE